MTDTYFNVLVKDCRPNIPDFDDIIKQCSQILCIHENRLKDITDELRQLSQAYQHAYTESEQHTIDNRIHKLNKERYKVDEYIEEFEANLQQAIDDKIQFYNDTDKNDPVNDIYCRLVREHAKARNVPENAVSIDNETGEITIIKYDLDQ